MKKIILSIFCAVASALLISSCGNSKGVSFAKESSFDAEAVAGLSAKRSSPAVYNDTSMAVMEEIAEAEYELPAPSESSPSYERKLILTGDINLEVESLEETRNLTEQVVKQLGGYISDSSEWRNGISITLRIPSNRFDEAMNSVSGIGKIRSKNINSSDVTDQFYDLDTRLNTKKVMLERLETYLKQAKDIKDMIEIESKINDVTTDIEVMQGQLNRLSSLIKYSTISINANLPVNQTEQGFTLPDAKSEFREFLWNIINFFVHFFFVILYIAIYGIPIIAVVLLLYWILLGKIGILRKIYSKIKAKK